MKRKLSLAVLAFEILAIIVLHTIKIHRMEQQGEEMNNSTAVKHNLPEIHVQHYLLMKVK